MIVPALVAIPFVAGLAALAIRRDAPRRLLLVAAAGIHSLLTSAAWLRQPEPFLNGWLAIDALGLLFLSITSLLFLVSSIYAYGYLQREGRGRRRGRGPTTAGRV